MEDLFGHTFKTICEIVTERIVSNKGGACAGLIKLVLHDKQYTEYFERRVKKASEVPMLKSVVFDICLYAVRDFMSRQERHEVGTSIVFKPPPDQLQWESLNFLGWAMYSLKQRLRNGTNEADKANILPLLEKLHEPPRKGKEQAEVVISESPLFEMINRGGLVQPKHSMLAFGSLVIEHVICYVKFDVLYDDVIDDALNLLLYNDKYQELFNTCAKEHIHDIEVPQQGQNVDKSLRYICKELATKIFHARVEVVIRAWNDLYTSRSKDKSNACSIREYLK
jgi:hypothetical protein